jgi:hypothetical protein
MERYNVLGSEQFPFTGRRDHEGLQGRIPTPTSRSLRIELEKHRPRIRRKHLRIRASPGPHAISFDLSACYMPLLEPHLQAEHMAAPTNAAYVKKVLANSESSTHGTFRTWLSWSVMSVHWGITNLASAPMHFRKWTRSGHWLPDYSAGGTDHRARGRHFPFDRF